MKKIADGLYTPIERTTQLVFQEPPEHFNPLLNVSACFMRVENRFLFLKRLSHKKEGNTWGIPGGKCEPNETAMQGVVREFYEETNVELKDSSLKSFGKVYIRYPDVDFIYHMFEYQLHNYPEIVINLKEHSEYRWILLQEALKLPLIPGEDECIHLCYSPSEIRNRRTLS